jgi:PKD repeat protein
MHPQRASCRRYALVLALVLFVIVGTALLLSRTATAAADSSPPVADAGPDATVHSTGAARLDGSASTDDVGVVAWTWTLEDAGVNVTLQGPVAYYPFTEAGVHTVTLNVTDAAGNWDLDTVLITVLTPPGPATRVLALDRDGYVEVKWGPPEEDGGSVVQLYMVYRGEAADAMGPFSLAGTEGYLGDAWVRNGHTYYYALRAMNEVGLGELSEVVNATPISVPQPPRNLTAVAANGTVHLSWEPPNEVLGSTGHTSYDVYRGTDPDMLHFLKNVRYVEEYVDAQAVPGTTYYYAVAAKADIGQSNLAGPVEVKVPGGGGTEEEGTDAALAQSAIVGLAIVSVVAVAAVVIATRRTGR